MFELNKKKETRVKRILSLYLHTARDGGTSNERVVECYDIKKKKHDVIPKSP